MTSEPTPCPFCYGQGRIWVYRIDDRKYPKKCNKCGGTGIARATLTGDSHDQ